MSQRTPVEHEENTDDEDTYEEGDPGDIFDVDSDEEDGDDPFDDEEEGEEDGDDPFDEEEFALPALSDFDLGLGDEEDEEDEDVVVPLPPAAAMLFQGTASTKPRVPPPAPRAKSPVVAPAPRAKSPVVAPPGLPPAMVPRKGVQPLPLENQIDGEEKLRKQELLLKKREEERQKKAEKPVNVNFYEENTPGLHVVDVTAATGGTWEDLMYRDVDETELQFALRKFLTEKFMKKLSLPLALNYARCLLLMMRKNVSYEAEFEAELYAAITGL